MNKIKFYKNNGILDHEEVLNENKHKLIRNDLEKYNKTYKKIIIKNINSIDTILYSNPKWGGRLTNLIDNYKTTPAKLNENQKSYAIMKK